MKRGRRAGRCYAIVKTLTARQISFGASTPFSESAGLHIRNENSVEEVQSNRLRAKWRSHVRDNSEPQFSLWLGIQLTVLAMALQ